MSFNSNRKPLKEVAINSSRRFNFSNKSKVIFINTGDVLNGKLLHRDYQDTNKLPGQAKKAIRKGDILYSEIRPGNKRHLFVDFECEDVVVSTKFMVIEAKNISPEYLYLVLTNNVIEKEFKSIADSRSGTFPQITFDSISHIPINIPSMEQQKRVSSLGFNFILWSDLISKIGGNYKEISQALFKSWFIDFAPVKAKIEAKSKNIDVQLAAIQVISGRTSKEILLLSKEKRQNLEAIANLFPDELEDTEYGKIPKGWEFSKLGEVVSFLSRGMTPKYTDTNKTVMVINQRCIRNHTIDFSNARFHNEELRAVKSKEIFVGDVLINSTGVGTLGRVALVSRLIKKTTVDTHVTIVRTDSQKIDPNYLGQYLLNKEPVIEEMGEGSTGQTELKRTVLNDMIICKPDLEIQAQFSNLIKPMIESIGIRELKNERLLSIRDVLIPKLLNDSLNFTE